MSQSSISLIGHRNMDDYTKTLFDWYHDLIESTWAKWDIIFLPGNDILFFFVKRGHFVDSMNLRPETIAQ